MQRLGFALILPCLCFLFCCSPKYEKALTAPDTKAVILSEPDYANMENWAAHPYKTDPSDLVPLPLQATHQYDSTVDVFFLHPTSYTDKEFRGWNASLSDSILNQKTDQSSIQYQASAFNEYRVFAPRYRQAYIDAYFTKDTAAAVKAFDLAYVDIKLAFQYYMDHFNGGRPIILVSHSQGSTHAKRLLSEFFDGKSLSNKLVVAYVLGMDIRETEFRELKFCLDSAQTSCLCGWRTFRSGFTPAYIKNSDKVSSVTNPLTWKTDSSYADRTFNNGSVLLNFNKVPVHVTDARIKNGMLWVNRLHMQNGIFIRRKNLHIGDINLFYVNLTENARTRAQVYKEKNKE